MAFLFILGGLCVNAADVADVISNPTKSESYGNKTFTGASKTEYLFAQASPQSGFFQIRQSKSSYITNTNSVGTISSISFSLTQGSVKVYGGNNAYTSYTTSPAGDEIETVSGTGDKVVTFTDKYDYFYIVPANSTIVKIADVKFTWAVADGPSEPVAYEPNFADVEIWEGNTAQIELGSKHPTSMIFVPEDETVASVDENGLITAHKIGSTTVTVSWDADDNFLAATEDVVFNVNVVEKPEVSEGTFDFSVKDPYGITSTSDGNHYETTATTCEDGIVTCVVDGKYRAWVKSNAYDIRLYKADSGKDNVGTFTISVPNGYKLVTVEFVDGIDGGIALKPSVGTLENNVWTAGANDGIVAFTATATTKVSKIIASYTVAFPKFEGTEHSFTTESSEIRIADADHAFDIYYRHTPAPAQNNVVARAEGEIADSFENKAEFDETNGQHVIPVSESGTLSYYAVHTATGKQSETNNITVTKTATTAIDAIGADNAEGEAEFFDIRGVKVNIDNAAPGLYIRRQGTTATKVVVK